MTSRFSKPCTFVSQKQTETFEIDSVNMLRTIIIDTEPKSLELILKDCVGSERIKLDKTFTSMILGLKHLRKYPVDVLFVDIVLAKAWGIDFDEKIGQNIKVVFTSTQKELAIDAYDMDALDFLLKPYSFERVESTLAKIVNYFNIQISSKRLEGNENIFVRANHGLQKFVVAEILYIEALGDYVNIYLQNQKRITTRMTMKDMMDRLNKSEFIRIHRKFIVSLRKIEKIKSKAIKIAGKDITIGNVYRKDALYLIKN